MHKTALSICSRCRLSFFQFEWPERWIRSSVQHHSRRFLSRESTRDGRPLRPQRNNAQRPPFNFKPSWSFARDQEDSRGTLRVEGETKSQVQDAQKFFVENVDKWTKRPPVRRRLEEFGLKYEDIPVLLTLFAAAVKNGELSHSPNEVEKYNLARFAHPIPIGTLTTHADKLYTNILYNWASAPEQQPLLGARVSKDTLSAIRTMLAAADMSYPAEAFPMARAMRRKVIMHVGPTNSGKTHNALRALAAAPVGVYAGPLRLLAHEIWERLNRGQIVPLGVDPTVAAEAEADESGGVDITDGAPTVRRVKDARYARECNLLTGEEQKIVSDEAGLLSCTVEMVSTSRLYDVAVVDEVQLLADPERGGAWTSSVLGLCARELHLCGEEAAVPIVEAMTRDTGDELIVNRYERLTPLIVEEESLGGDLGRVRRGDCLVTFSRSNIFKLKKQVEEMTGLRCAVAYGRLPPETRSEQAALFNDPESGYDVMIGSDAIGMGLNLKIKRVIFEAVKKFDGTKEVALSLSQIKQIAGRAGRYGLHGDNSPGGYVTTLHAPDLPILRKALAAPAQPLPSARIGTVGDVFASVCRALPPNARLKTIYDARLYLSNLRSVYQYAEVARISEMCEFIDRLGGDKLRMIDRTQLMNAPIQWRDDAVLDIVANFMRMYHSEMRVDLQRALHGTEMLPVLEEVEGLMAAGGRPISSPRSLGVLESLHKMLVLYMWMSFRLPVAYADHEEVQDLKTRTEKALDWSLQGIAWGDSGERENPQVYTRGRMKEDAIEWKTLREARSESEALRSVGRQRSGVTIGGSDGAV